MELGGGGVTQLEVAILEGGGSRFWVPSCDRAMGPRNFISLCFQVMRHTSRGGGPRPQPLSLRKLARGSSTCRRGPSIGPRNLLASSMWRVLPVSSVAPLDQDGPVMWPDDPEPCAAGAHGCFRRYNRIVPLAHNRNVLIAICFVSVAAPPRSAAPLADPSAHRPPAVCRRSPTSRFWRQGCAR